MYKDVGTLISEIKDLNIGYLNEEDKKKITKILKTTVSNKEQLEKLLSELKRTTDFKNSSYYLKINVFSGLLDKFHIEHNHPLPKDHSESGPYNLILNLILSKKYAAYFPNAYERKEELNIIIKRIMENGTKWFHKEKREKFIRANFSEIISNLFINAFYLLIVILIPVSTFTDLGLITLIILGINTVRNNIEQEKSNTLELKFQILKIPYLENTAQLKSANYLLENVDYWNNQDPWFQNVNSELLKEWKVGLDYLEKRIYVFSIINTATQLVIYLVLLIKLFFLF